MKIGLLPKKHKGIYKKLIVFVIILSLITPVGFLAQPNKIHAQGLPVYDNANFLVNSITASAVTVLASEYAAKEFGFDSIAWMIANIVLDQMAFSIVNWINSGFQGSPAFITDFDQFLIDIADEKIGEIIYGSALNFLCDPLDIKFSLALKYATPFRKRVECTLSDIVENIDKFIDGDFGSGGWEGWMELTTRQTNNRYGAYLASAAELEASITFARGREIKLLDFNSGFLSKKVCEEGPSPRGGGPGAPVNCRIVTPGSVIQTQLNKALGFGTDRLLVADEFNEIIGALMGQLLKKVIVGARGLLGTSVRSTSTGRSYLDDIMRQRSVQSQGVFNSSRDRILVQADSAIRNERAYLLANQTALDSVTATEDKLVQLSSCYEEKLLNTTINLTNTQKQTAQSRINDASDIIANRISSQKDEFSNEIVLSDARLDTLVSARNDIASKTKLEVDFNTTTGPLAEMIASGTIRNEIDVINAENRRNSVVGEMNNLQYTTEAGIVVCNAFPSAPSGGGGTS